MIFGLEGKSFEWVFKNKKEFVDFTVKEMGSPTGLFAVWKNYCENKIKEAYAKNTSRGIVKNI